MKTFSKIVAVFGLLTLSTGAFGDSKPQDILAALDDASVTYTVSTDGKLTILQTKRTTEAVEAIAATGDIVRLFGFNWEIVDLAPSFEEAQAQRLRDQRRNERKN